MTLGSLGPYSLSGTVPVDVPMELTSPDKITGHVNEDIGYPLTATDLFEYGFVGPTPPELSAIHEQPSDGSACTLVFRATEPGRFQVTIGAKRRSEIFTKVIEVVIRPHSDDLAAALHPTFPSNSQPTTTEAAPWTIDKEVKADNHAAVRSGTVLEGQASAISTSVGKGGLLRFHWRVNSAPGSGALAFRIDGVEQARITGQVEWEERSFPLPFGNHVLEWLYEKTGGEVAGADAGWVDRCLVETVLPVSITSPLGATGILGKPFEYQIEASNEPREFFATGLPDGLALDSTTGMIAGIPQAIGTYSVTLDVKNLFYSDRRRLELRILGENAPLGDVLDAAALAWVTEGEAPWRAGIPYVVLDKTQQVRGVGPPDIDAGNGAAQAGAIPDGGRSVLRTTVSGPTHLRFYWKVDCEETADYLAFFIDGVEQARISGSVDWRLEAFRLATGVHTIEWHYMKDSVKAVGADTAWVDRVEVRANGFEINRALDEPLLQYRATPPRAWNLEFSEAATNAIKDGESATIETEVVGPCQISWDWSVTCERENDYFACTVDEREVARITMGSGLRHESIRIPKGRHTIAWSYQQDFLISEGSRASLANAHVDTTPLQLHLDGVGKVTQDFAGLSEQKPGDSLTITATPVDGSTFTGWTSNTGIISSSRTLNFNMELGLELTAHFAPGPFTLLKGRYLGLFEPAADEDGASSLLDLQVTSFGAFTGSLAVRGIAVPLQGQFAGDGSFAQTVQMPDGSLSELLLSLDVAGATPHISGTLTGAGTAAALAVDRAARDSEAFPFLAGPYTALLETDLADTVAPRGIGFATGEMTVSGKLRLAGRLGDGRSFSLATKFAENGTAPIYLWAGNSGSELAGTISLEDAQLRGTLRWRRPPGAGAAFDTAITVRGSPYAKPANGAPVFPGWPAAEENGWISLGDIVGGRFTLGPDHVPRLSPPNDAHVTLSLSLANGLFTGSFRLEGADKATTFSGALLPGENRAGGIFRQSNGESEAVRIEAAP